jgi:hypothetical protein
MPFQMITKRTRFRLKDGGTAPFNVVKVVGNRIHLSRDEGDDVINVICNYENLIEIDHVVRDTDGNVIKRYQDFKSVRRFIGTRFPLIKTVAIDEVANGRGILSILFTDGSSYQRGFLLFGTIQDTLRGWMKVWGAPLMVNGVPEGTVGRDNPALNSWDN